MRDTGERLILVSVQVCLYREARDLWGAEVTGRGTQED